MLSTDNARICIDRCPIETWSDVSLLFPSCQNHAPWTSRERPIWRGREGCLNTETRSQLFYLSILIHDFLIYSILQPWKPLIWECRLWPGDFAPLIWPSYSGWYWLYFFCPVSFRGPLHLIVFRYSYAMNLANKSCIDHFGNFELRSKSPVFSNRSQSSLFRTVPKRCRPPIESKAGTRILH